MIFRSYWSNWKKLEKAALFHRNLWVISVIANLILAYGVVFRDHTVILVPPELTGKAEVSEHGANQEYVEEWSLAMSELLGNITPDNAQFTRDQVERLLSPDILASTLLQIDKQAEELKASGVKQRFVAQKIIYEAETKKVFVWGQVVAAGALGDTTRQPETYEFLWHFRDYRPVLESIATYKGRPRTLEELARLHQEQKDRQKQLNRVKQAEGR